MCASAVNFEVAIEPASIALVTVPVSPVVTALPVTFGSVIVPPAVAAAFNVAVPEVLPAKVAPPDPIAGVVMVGPRDDVSRENLLAIEHYGRVAVLGEMPMLNPLTPERLRGWAEASLDADGRLTDFLS